MLRVHIRRLAERARGPRSAGSMRWLPNSYTGKLLFGVFIGTHVPMVALLLYLLAIADVAGGLRWEILAVALGATVVGFGITVSVLYQLILPVELASKALRAYVDHKAVPDLPTHKKDLAGRLLADVQYTVEHMVELTETLEKTALYDYLTGCYTRRAGTERLRSDIARVERGEGRFSFALLDIDNFKELNDKRGHAFGDRCLKSLTEIVDGKLRRGDWLARWGGDEFVLLLWDVGVDSAADILARIMRVLHDNPCYTEDEEPVYMQVSAGVCQFDGGSDEYTLLRSADRALYKGKNEKNGSIIKTALAD